jgi:2-dehydropantoate 2-reductase
MKIAIFGIGGVGGYFGGRLAQAGRDVTFITRGANLFALRETGLRVDSICGDFVLSTVKVSEASADVGPFDLLIVTTKAWQLEKSIDQLDHLVSENTFILPLLNGIEHIHLLQSRFGRGRVLGGLCRISVFRESAGYIRHVAVQPRIEFGVIEVVENQSRANQVVESLLNAFKGVTGVEAIKPPDTLAAVWHKFVLMSAISGVSALTKQCIGYIRSEPTYRQMLLAAINETVDVGRAHGVILPHGIVDDIMSIIDVTEYHMKTSMQRDLETSSPSELEAQTGAAIRLGRAVGVATPTHDAIHAALLPLELAANRGSMKGA